MLGDFKGCPKCEDEMAPAKVGLFGSAIHLIAETPLANGAMLPEGTMPLTAWCCCQCGYVELYAAEQIGPN
jgi:predicted nucleic-acid-binding Zn-ribbon protein